MGSKVPKSKSFVPLLMDIQNGLGNHWTFYEECISGVLDAAAKQQDTTAWFEQMQQLVEGIKKIRFSHEGIIFLLQDMGIHPPKQRSSGEGDRQTGKFHSPNLTPPEHYLQTSLLSIASMSPCPVHSFSAMPSFLCLRSVRPFTPTINDWPALRAPTSSNQQQQPQVLRDGVLPFDFSASVQPGLTFPKDFRAYHCPPDQILLTENFARPTLHPLKEFSNNPVFFSDSALRADIAEAFRFTVLSNNDNHNGLGQARQRLPYNVHDDDLMTWRTRLETGADDGVVGVKATGCMTDTWNLRSDLDLSLLGQPRAEMDAVSVETLPGRCGTATDHEPMATVLGKCN